MPLAPGGELYAPAEARTVPRAYHSLHHHHCLPTRTAFLQVVSSGSHNSEVPELYGAHPFRLLSVGRCVVDPSVNLTIGVATWNALPLAKANEGW